MSYETTNYLPKGVSKRHVAEFIELLGYKRAGSYAHLGMSDVISMTYFEEKDYKSWQVVELSIGVSEEIRCRLRPHPDADCPQPL